MSSEPEEIWWNVKVYHPQSESYTHLSKYAKCVEDIENELKEDGHWVFVKAEPEE